MFWSGIAGRAMVAAGDGRVGAEEGRMSRNSSMTVAPSAESSPSRPVERARLYRLGVWAALHPLIVLVAWLVLLGGALVSAGYFTSHLTGSTNVVSGSDSEQAARLMRERFPHTPHETDFVVISSRRLVATDDAFRGVVSAAINRYGSAPAVGGTISPYDAPDRLISSDRHTALLAVNLEATTDKQAQDAAKPLGDLAPGLRTNDVDVSFTGAAPLAAAGVEQGAVDLARAESIGLPAAAVVLLIAFGSLVAAAIPLGLGILTVLAAFGALGVVAVFTPFDVFVQTAVSMVSIALGIDYSLFIVTRFREELARVPSGSPAPGGSRPDRAVANVARADRAVAVGRTMASAGNAVLFSGTTVAVALAGLWLVRSPKVHSMAIGMMAAVLVMMLVTVTLLPALLGLLGHRVNRLALPWARTSLAHPDPEHSVWARITAFVMRRPVAVAVLATVLLGALALPVFGLRYGVDLGAAAVADSPAGKGFTVVSQSFAPGVLSPIDVVVSSGGPSLNDAQLAAIATLSTATAADPEVADVVSLTAILDQAGQGHGANVLLPAIQAANGGLDTVVSRDGSTSVITVRPRASADSAQTAALVRRLRADARRTFNPAGLTVHIGGAPADIVDITDESSRAMPLVIGVVLAASWVLLLIAFRSLVLPFKAILMNLLTSGAAFGAAVLIFQSGHGAGLFGVDRTGFIQVILPLFAFALVFGLSMDYEVFMLSRMREEWDHVPDNRRAVQLGITRTARVITAAATIMVVVFGSFMFTRILEIKQMGFMLGLAVLIDASIVRLLLVPALMRLMGAWNWWLPRRLERLLPRISAGPH
jgi:RND superfamily putative drug exporter